jgi:hypothetical protein
VVRDGDQGAAVDNAWIVVKNVPPTPKITGIPVSGHSPEGLDISLGSSVTDPSRVDTAAGFTYHWSVTKNGVDVISWSGADFPPFAPDDNGTYVVTLTATDKDGGVGTTSTTILVDNVAPTASITGVPASGHSPEGSHVLLGSTVTDPSYTDTAAGFTYVWRVNGVVYASGNSPVFAFTPDDDGNFVVTLTVTDKDGGVSPVAQATIVADNVAPTASLSGPTDGIPGQERTFTLTAADPSTSDQNTGFTFAIAWGDGTSEKINGPSGTTISHAYAKPGNYSLRVTATDKNGGISNTAAQTETIARPNSRAALSS